MTHDPDRQARAAATWLYQEAAQSPDVVARQLDSNRAALATLGARLRAAPPAAVVTCARGSSDHAATYAKYLIETRTGTLTASAAPSIASLYGTPQRLAGCLFLAISQSGASPDLLACARAARDAGALVVALCNAPQAPLCSLADVVVPLCAGPERAVAATKSFVASLSAIAQLVAAWSQDPALQAELDALPDRLARAWALDWSAALPVLAPAEHLYAVGRGLGLSVAQEAALKAKETIALHAEAYSGAEVRHGPYTLPGARFPVMMLAQDDVTRPGLIELAGELAARGVPVLTAGAAASGGIELPSVPGGPALAPAPLALSCYRLLASLAIARGVDPDAPAHLRKVTQTL